MNKNITTAKVREGVANAKNAGIQTVGLFMLGLPGETPEMSRETVEFSVDLDLDFAKYAITVPFPGSKLFDDRWQKDLFRDDWENYTTFNPDPDRLIYHPHGHDPEEPHSNAKLGFKTFTQDKLKTSSRTPSITPKMLPGYMEWLSSNIIPMIKISSPLILSIYT